MIPIEFEYEAAVSWEEAVQRLAQHKGRARPVAGGTDLFPNMRAEIASADLLIALSHMTPAPPRQEADGSLRLDALSRLATLAKDPVVRRHAPMVAEAAHVVASNQIRHMGTLGGNLCQDNRCLYYNQIHDYQFVAPCYKRGGDCCYPFPGNDRDTCWAVYMSDVAPALIALDAEVDILSVTGTRRVPVAALFSGNALAPLTLGAEELVRAVYVPVAPEDHGWAFRKLSPRGGLEFAMVTLAVSLVWDPASQRCRQARIVFGAIGEGPLRPGQAEAALRGSDLSSDHLAEVAKAAAKEVNPLPHHGYSKRYMRDAIAVHLRRLLQDAKARCHEPS